jgi:serine/threonine protein kinase
MNDAQRERAEDVFVSALAVPVEERAAWVRRACGDEPEVLAEVLSLLEFAEGTDGYLAALAANAGAPYGADRRQEPGLEGERIGHYELVREIGRGGMGAVYLAERVDGEFDQRVAIKLLRRGLDTDDILARFRIERQILASLNHPHIARLFDGGATEGGRPYLVMELVEGVPITEYCDRHRLTVGERLRLFVQVARAVQHAHGKLIAHRDIKPSNILVTAEGTPKLLDFGIARLLDDAYAAEAKARTRTGLRLMTPEYASPEQVRGEPVTTASDAYQLGVLLYQLLAGRRPYRLRGRTAHQIERIVGEQDRPSPSATLLAGPKSEDRGGTSDGTGGEPRGPTREEPEPGEIARLRRTDVRRLRARLRGDLDTILLKAVDTDQGRRYASAGELADDIERHLDGLPILARQPSIRYRAGKLVRRHRVAVALVALAVTAAMTAGAWESWRTVQVNAERDRTHYEAERNRARYAVERAGAVPRIPQGSRAIAINDHGVVVGPARNEYGEERAVRWVVDANGRVTGPERFDTSKLPFNEGDWTVTQATGINNQGTVVGYDGMGNPYRALIYHDGEARLLSQPAGAISAWALGINHAGWVVGAGRFPEAAGVLERGLVWIDPLNPDDQPLQLPPLPGERPTSRGLWINDSGVVGGWSVERHVSWRIGAERSVSEPEPLGTGRAFALNDAAATVGQSPDRQAYFQPAGSDMLELPPLHGHGGGVAYGLNSPEAGERTLVVGFSVPDSSSWLPRHAVVWTVHSDGSVDGPTELEAADGYSNSGASDVNAHGWIVGESNNGPSGQMATLWQPLQNGEGYAVIPLGSFGAGPSASLVHLCEKGACSFADTSIPGSGPLTAWSWASGAGQTANAREASFTYRAPGRYMVTLQVTNMSRRTDEAQVEINCTRRLLGGVRCR